MVNYNESMVYKICCNDLNVKEIYVGSTCNFNRRKQNHKQRCNDINGDKYHLKVYKFIRDHGGWFNWSMVLLENVNVNSKLELHKKEREYLEKLGATLNNIIPTRTINEWREDRKEHIFNRNKKFREDNKEKIQKMNKEKYIKNREHILKYQKEYAEKGGGEFKEKNKKKQSQFREKNRDKINERIKEWSKIEVLCDCGVNVKKGSLSKHKKTKKHIEIMKGI
jgi:hypothetical protein